MGTSPVRDRFLTTTVHTPTSTFAYQLSSTDSTLDRVWDELGQKAALRREAGQIGPGWMKYEWEGTIVDLDDAQDFSIFLWRHRDESHDGKVNPVWHIHNPDVPLPDPTAYRNPNFYQFRTRPTPTVSQSPPPPPLPRVRREHAADKTPQYERDFKRFHSENGVRTVLGSIGLVTGVRMLLKAGYRHVYISRGFALKNGFVPKDTTPGLYGYGGLVNIGQWPIVVGRTKTIHTILLSEESHFDCILGRSFMERRGIKTDPTDVTSVVCMDTGEKVDCEVVIIRDGNGEIVTVT